MFRTSMLIAATLTSVAMGPALAHGEDPSVRKGSSAAANEQQAWGIAGNGDEVTRTVEIRMSDRMRFTPDRLTVRVGETVRFVVFNEGRLMHELVIGSKPVLDRHAELMRKFPNMEHDEPYMAHVAPGRRGEIVWKFNRAGEFDFGCLVPGHYESGMIGKVTVVAS
jgi:uncharacterized cupredoxin-like copper-binding protein